MLESTSDDAPYELDGDRAPAPTAPPDDPHRGIPTYAVGCRLERAAGAVILLHGRNRTARGILRLHELLDRPDYAYLAPQAADRTWYPLRFLEPVHENEPRLTSAMDALERLVDRVHAAGIERGRIALVGFSQGACLVAEFLARRPRRLGGASLLIGGLFGPPDRPLGPYEGSLGGMPIFMCSSDPDPFVPPERVRDSAEIFRSMGAQVTVRVQPGADHVITEEGVSGTRTLLRVMDLRTTRPAATAVDVARAPVRRPAPASGRPTRIHPTAP